MAETATLATPAVTTPVDIRPERVRSTDPAAFPIIHDRTEEWKFTPMDRLRPLLVEDAGSSGDVGLDTFIDGQQDGVSFGLVHHRDTLVDDLPLPVDALSARAAALGRRGTKVLRIDKGAEVPEPIRVRLSVADGETEVRFSHLVLDVGEHARATVVLEHSGSARLVGKVSVLVGDGASLDLVQVRRWDEGALEATHVAYRLGRDARLRSTSVSLGGSLVRVIETVDYTATGGDADLRGLALADNGQHLEHRLFVDHTTSHCRSRASYKNALQGSDSRTVWIGDVLIRAQAVGTDTYEFNRNLLLSPDARADSVPNLEIETGEITGAGHASATGRFDDEQLFYLQSRGIPAEVARRMVVRGFFAEIIEGIGVPDLQDSLLREVGRLLGQQRDDETTLSEAAP